MLNSFLSALIPSLLAGSTLLLIAPVVGWWRLTQSRQTRHSPLTQDLLRAPGHSLRAKIDEIGEQIGLYLVMLVITPFLIFSVHLSQSYFANQPETLMRIVTSILIVLGAGGFFGSKLIKALQQKRLFILGLEGELATGEELNHMMLEGCRVFHDIPFPYGNIDHVVVSKSGVFSVNTKMVGKPISGEGKAKVVVDHSKNQIEFPEGRTWNIPNDQLEREAKWLCDHLQKSVGESIKVEPMLALPGWFIDKRIGRGSVYVFNPNKPIKFFLNSRTQLSDKQISQVAHQLEQLIRDVKPSYKKEKKWVVES